MVRLVDACLRFDRWLTPYVDDELDAVHCLEVEQHLAGCEHCRERVALACAMRGSLRMTAHRRAPAGLRERLHAALAEERDEVEGVPAAEAAQRRHEAPAEARPVLAAEASPAHASRKPQGAQLVKLRYVFPLAAAAMFVLILGGVWHRGQGSVSQRSGAGANGASVEARSEPAGPSARTASAFPISLPGDSESQSSEQSWPFGPDGEITAASALAPLDGLIEDLVAHHVAPLPPEITDPRSLERLGRDVGVRVARPQFEPFGGRYIGARMRPVIGNHAAVLQYMMRNTHRVTVYVFDPQRVPMRAGLLEARNVGSQHVFVGRLRGYSVAASSGNGVGYALASDLSDEESSKLVLAAAMR
jgi:anti-sigma factor RsiW